MDNCSGCSISLYNLSDIDLEDTLNYHIQLDDSSNFNSPEVDESGVGLNTILKVVNNQWKMMNPKTKFICFYQCFQWNPYVLVPDISRYRLFL